MKILKSKLHKAFTLAELMVILAVMTVVIAAVAPVITSKYNTLMSSEVWHEVPDPGDSRNCKDVYTDGVNHILLQQIMVGVSPLDLADIKANYKPYSKLVIRSSDRVNENFAQPQIEFYHGETRDGVLFAGRENLLLSSFYEGMKPQAIGNTAFGMDALMSIETGKGNTAIGKRALSANKTGDNNTAIGTYAGSTATGSNNVYIGYKANANGNYNTVISNDIEGVSANYSTAVGDNISFAGSYNVALGYNADASGNYNTAVGAYAISRFSEDKNKSNSGTRNTAVGYMSCANLDSGAYNKTCIGQAGASTILDGSHGAALSGSDPQVMIGRGNRNLGSAAAVVVSSSTGDVSVGDGITIGNASVVVYGNLIVRGQTFMYGRSPFPQSTSDIAFNPAKNPSLMGYILYREVTGNHKPFVGLDGSGITTFLTGTNGYLHQVYGGREHCICTQNISSYDWTSSVILPNTFDNLLGDYSYLYSGSSDSPSVELSRSHSLYTNLGAEGSCCPILTSGGVRRGSSDARLKNIGEKFSDGLAKLEKIKIYNFTFKSDKSKTSQVGVMAQDLKTIFSNSVSKNEKGYYTIRWDEMFYSAINSVKELNSKIVALTKRVKNDFDRIVKLKQENKKLEDKLIKLADEIEKLEQQK